VGILVYLILLEDAHLSSLRKRLRARSVRLAKADFLAKLDESRKYTGSYNNPQYIDVTSYYNGSGISGGPYYCVVQNSKSVTRNIQRGNFKTTTPYRKFVTDLSGSTGVGFLTSVTNPWWSLTFKRWGQYVDASANWWGGYDISQSMRNSLVSSTQMALLSKMRNMAPTWDILTSAVELKETLSSIKGAATWFATLIRHVSLRNVPSIMRHLRLKKSKANRKRIIACYTDDNGFNHYYSSGVSVPFKQLNVMQNLWMSYRYSMMTTIYDMQDALIALAAPKRAKDYELKAQVTLHDSCYSGGSLGFGTVFGNGSDTLAEYSKTLSINGSIREKAWFSFYEDILDRINPNTINSLCKTAWEEIPFSWVADWFLDISGYLQLLDLSSLIQKSDVCVSERGNVRSSYYLTGYKANVPNSPGYSGSVKISIAPGGGASVGNSFYFDRSVGSVTVPSWSPSETWYTWKRGLDASSLAWQKVRNSLSEPLPKVRL